MSELQNDSGIPESTGESVNKEPVIENQENGADLAPASGAEHKEQPPVEDDAEAKAKAAQNLATNEAINKQHKKFQDEKRKAEGLQNQLDEINRKEHERLAESFKNAPAMPIMPTFPTTDQFDDNYEGDVKKFHDGVAQYNANMPLYYQQLTDKANYDAQVNASVEQQKTLQQQEQQQQGFKMQEQQIAYTVRSNELGIKPEELEAAGNAVAQYGLSNDLVMHILSDKDGPLITRYLAANPRDGVSLASMNPYNVGAFLDVIKSKTAELKPKTTETPPPVEQLSGSGAKPNTNEYPNSEGATFE